MCLWTTQTTTSQHYLKPNKIMRSFVYKDFSHHEFHIKPKIYQVSIYVCANVNLNQILCQNWGKRRTTYENSRNVNIQLFSLFSEITVLCYFNLSNHILTQIVVTSTYWKIWHCTNNDTYTVVTVTYLYHICSNHIYILHNIYINIIFIKTNTK